MSSANPSIARELDVAGIDHLERLYARFSDISARLGSDDQIRLHSLVLDKIRQGLCVYDNQQRLLLFNRRYAEMYSLRPEDLRLGMTMREVVALRYAAGTGPDMTKEEYAAWRDRIAIEDRVVETVVELQNGVIHEIHHEPTPGGGWVATFDDITERRRCEARIQHMAHHDALTGLANRFLFTERLTQMVTGLADGDIGALLCLDLDRFKQVNDTLGHPAGDELLKHVASRLRDQLRETDTLARLGGDEFAIILKRIEHRDQATATALNVTQAISVPFHLNDECVNVGVSVGIAFCESCGREICPDELFLSADRALYHSKSHNRGGYCVSDVF